MLFKEIDCRYFVACPPEWSMETILKLLSFCIYLAAWHPLFCKLPGNSNGLACIIILRAGLLREQGTLLGLVFIIWVCNKVVILATLSWLNKLMIGMHICSYCFFSCIFCESVCHIE